MSKLEELDSPQMEKPKRNPFAPAQRTTIKRERDEVYPAQKGLHKPQFMGDSPLDVLFQKLETLFDTNLEDTTLASLASRVFSPEQLAAPQEKVRYMLVEQLLQWLVQVQQYSLQAKEEDKKKDLISISLHDIKTFGKLVNLIILLGIYPAISAFNIGVPLEKRRLNDFGKPVYKPLSVTPLAKNKFGKTYTEQYADHADLLKLLYDKLLLVFSTESDVRELLMKGSGYSDFLVVTITLATLPYFDAELRSLVLANYSTITELASTYELYQDYSVLVATSSPNYFKHFVLDKLQLLPYDAPKGDGVLTLVKFVLGLRDHDEISVEKFDHVTSVLLLKPKSVPTVAYFTSIGNQCYDLLVNINKPTITSCIGSFVEKLWYRHPKIAEDFIINKIWENFDPIADQDKLVLVSEATLNNTINVCLSLSNRGLPNELLVTIFKPILVSLWSYYAFMKRNEKLGEIVQNILVSYLTQVETDKSFASAQLARIAGNVAAEGGIDWKFRMGPNQLVEIYYDKDSVLKKDSSEKKVLLFVNRLDSSCKSFMELLRQLDGQLVLKLFVVLLSDWVRDQSFTQIGGVNPFLKLSDLRILEGIGNDFKDSLAQTPQEILELLLSILQNRGVIKKEQEDEDIDSDDEDESPQAVENEVLTTVLELLSAIITETQPAELDGKCRDLLTETKKVISTSYMDLPTARALGDRIGYLLQGDTFEGDDVLLQKRAFTRAVTSLNDPLVPIRAHGLFLLRQLVEQRSSVLSIDFVVNIHVVQLKDPEPFVYLNAIKGLESLLQWDAPQMLPSLVSIYDGEVDDTSALDERLRVGEVLLRFVQVQDEAFTGASAQLVVDGTIKLIRRPKEGEPTVDNRLRMSAMSILGTCCNTNPLGMINKLEDALDCAIGILQLETGKDSAIMRRSAIVLIHDLIQGTSRTDRVPFPRLYMQKVVTVLRYVQSNDTDLLVREQAQTVLYYINELVERAVETEDSEMA